MNDPGPRLIYDLGSLPLAIQKFCSAGNNNLLLDEPQVNRRVGLRSAWRRHPRAGITEEIKMRRNIRSIVIALTVSLAAVPMLAGCVVVPGYHGYWHGGGHWRR
jgi:hypothetical protein